MFLTQRLYECYSTGNKKNCERTYHDGCIELLLRSVTHYPACEVVDNSGAKVKINCTLYFVCKSLDTFCWI